MRVTIFGFPDGARVWHRDWRLFGTVRHFNTIGSTYAMAEVRWDGHWSTNDLGGVAARLASL